MTEICFVFTTRQNRFFVEVAEALAFELGRLGVVTRISRDGFPPARDGLVYALLPPHEYRGLAPPEHWPTPRQLERTLFYCFEQPGTGFFDRDVEMAKGPVGAVLDLNAASVEELRRRGVTAHHAPVGWTEAWSHPGPGAPDGPPRERDVDLLHLGSYSARRGELLARSAPILARRRTRLVLGDPHRPNFDARANFTVGRGKWELLARSRVLLNIHIGDRPYFEWLRVVQAICNGTLVVSELSDDTTPLRAGEHFAMTTADAVVALADDCVEDEPLRAEMAAHAQRFLRDELPLSDTAAVVAELAADVDRRATVRGARSPLPGDGIVSWPDNAGIRAEVDQAVRAATAPAAAGTAAGDPGGDATVLVEDPAVELFPGGIERLTAALRADRHAAFAWGMVADGSELRNVFPWQPSRLDEGAGVEPPVLWRESALRALVADGEGRADPGLYRRAAERGWHGAHVPEVVARRSGNRVVFGCAVTDRETFEAQAMRGIRRAAGDGAEVLVREGYDSIQEPYNDLMDEAAGRENLEALVLVHQDLELLDDSLLRRALPLLGEGGFGVVGLFGARAACMHCLPASADLYGRGTTPPIDLHHSSGPHEVEVVDGSLLAIAPWVVKAVRFDEALAADFHGYDLDFCARVRAVGGRVACIDVPYMHHMDRPWTDLAAARRAASEMMRRWDPGLRPAEWAADFAVPVAPSARPGAPGR